MVIVFDKHRYLTGIILFLLIIVGFLNPTLISAANEFSTSYDITYDVRDNGMTTTRQVVSLTNEHEYIYATEYFVNIGSTQLSDIKAVDDFGELLPEVTQQDNATVIKLNFDKKIIGKDKTRTVVLTYSTPDFAMVKGKVLEVGFPLLNNSHDLSDYSVTVTIPQQFGLPTQIVPAEYEHTSINGRNGYRFSQEVLSSAKGITATFGTEQIVDFSLRYTLVNDHNTKGRTEIALPADTNYQRVLYKSIDPKPDTVTIDEDGNWLAEYIINPKSTIIVTAKGSAQINYYPLKEFARPLTEDEVKRYTQSDTYWEAENPIIKDLAKKHTTPQEIYTFLTTNFIYDYGRLSNNTERFGAVKAVQNPDNTICMEFTDAFIAMARANKIPAREHNGYAYTQNEKLRPLSLQQDVLHAWPEYYDFSTQQWIQIDPTWGNTTGGLDFFNKFDLDHFTFVIHGSNSSYPVTVGSYKTDKTEGKDVEITFGTEFEPIQKASIALTSQPSGYTGLPFSIKLVVENTGTTALYALPLSLSLNKDSQAVWSQAPQAPTIPPFSSYELMFKYVTNWQENGGDYSLTTQILGENQTIEFQLNPIVKASYLAILGGSSFGILLWVVSYSLSVKRQRKQREDIDGHTLESDIVKQPLKVNQLPSL